MDDGRSGKRFADRFAENPVRLRLTSEGAAQFPALRRYRGPQADVPTAGKKWLRGPLFGPARLTCCECRSVVWVGYFSAVRRCACGSERFVPAR
jgi:hypothetical protein